MTSKEQSEDGQDLGLGNYVICLIDLLGQKEKLKGWSSLPRNGQLTPEVTAALNETLGTVLWFKKKFYEFFNQFEITHLSEQQLSSMTPNQQSLLARFKNSTLGVQQFADTFVFFAPISNDHGDRMIDPFYRIITASCMAMLVSLAAKLPLRGAITMGSGAQPHPGNIYGPALAQAHHLESNVAKSPRIVVDKEVADFLAQRSGYSDEPMIDAVTVQLAATCRSFLWSDSDNHLIVDFVGQAIKTICADEGGKIADTVRMAFDFVRQEHARYVNIADPKLTPRYAALLKYMTSRMPTWGIAT